eukprot:TRINITY_DN2322_c0_g1_i1.p1 TRINITY_DN2322_c0_g1~~TRINITY_DN2322_c0_g1_i1.p1  ORF type:complete len:2533 (-),score=726.29 TRINITY_DN2322_c0_g1_i1:218-7279(-)
MSAKHQASLELFFDAGLLEINEATFTHELLEGLVKLGVTEADIPRLRLELVVQGSDKSVLARIHGPAVVVDSIRVLPLRMLSVMGSPAMLQKGELVATQVFYAMVADALQDDVQEDLLELFFDTSAPAASEHDFAGLLKESMRSINISEAVIERLEVQHDADCTRVLVRGPKVLVQRLRQMPLRTISVLGHPAMLGKEELDASKAMYAYLIDALWEDLQVTRRSASEPRQGSKKSLWGDSGDPGRRPATAPRSRPSRSQAGSKEDPAEIPRPLVTRCRPRQSSFRLCSRSYLEALYARFEPECGPPATAPTRAEQHCKEIEAFSPSISTEAPTAEPPPSLDLQSENTAAAPDRGMQDEAPRAEAVDATSATMQASKPEETMDEQRTDELPGKQELKQVVPVAEEDDSAGSRQALHEAESAAAQGESEASQAKAAEALAAKEAKQAAKREGAERRRTELQLLKQASLKAANATLQQEQSEVVEAKSQKKSALSSDKENQADDLAKSKTKSQTMRQSILEQANHQLEAETSLAEQSTEPIKHAEISHQCDVHERSTAEEAEKQQQEKLVQAADAERWKDEQLERALEEGKLRREAKAAAIREQKQKLEAERQEKRRKEEERQQAALQARQKQQQEEEERRKEEGLKQAMQEAKHQAEAAAARQKDVEMKAREEEERRKDEALRLAIQTGKNRAEVKAAAAKKLKDDMKAQKEDERRKEAARQQVMLEAKQREEAEAAKQREQEMKAFEEEERRKDELLKQAIAEGKARRAAQAAAARQKEQQLQAEREAEQRQLEKREQEARSRLEEQAAEAKQKEELRKAKLAAKQEEKERIKKDMEEARARAEEQAAEARKRKAQMKAEKERIKAEVEAQQKEEKKEKDGIAKELEAEQEKEHLRKEREDEETKQRLGMRKEQEEVSVRVKEQAAEVEATNASEEEQQGKERKRKDNADETSCSPLKTEGQGPGGTKKDELAPSDSRQSNSSSSRTAGEMKLEDAQERAAAAIQLMRVSPNALHGDGAGSSLQKDAKVLSQQGSPEAGGEPQMWSEERQAALVVATTKMLNAEEEAVAAVHMLTRFLVREAQQQFGAQPPTAELLQPAITSPETTKQASDGDKPKAAKRAVLISTDDDSPKHKSPQSPTSATPKSCLKSKSSTTPEEAVKPSEESSPEEEYEKAMATFASESQSEGGGEYFDIYDRQGGSATSIVSFNSLQGTPPDPGSPPSTTTHEQVERPGAEEILGTSANMEHDDSPSAPESKPSAAAGQSVSQVYALDDPSAPESKPSAAAGQSVSQVDALDAAPPAAIAMPATIVSADSEEQEKEAKASSPRASQLLPPTTEEGIGDTEPSAAATESEVAKEKPRPPCDEDCALASSDVCECGNVLMTDALFCRKCGAERKKSAPVDRKPGQVCSCGNVFMEDSKFCRKCGQKRPRLGLLQLQQVAQVAQAATAAVAAGSNWRSNVGSKKKALLVRTVCQNVFHRAADMMEFVEARALASEVVAKNMVKGVLVARQRHIRQLDEKLAQRTVLHCYAQHAARLAKKERMKTIALKVAAAKHMDKNATLAAAGLRRHVTDFHLDLAQAELAVHSYERGKEAASRNWQKEHAAKLKIEEMEESVKTVLRKNEELWRARESNAAFLEQHKFGMRSLSLKSLQAEEHTGSQKNLSRPVTARSEAALCYSNIYEERALKEVAALMKSREEAMAKKRLSQPATTQKHPQRPSKSPARKKKPFQRRQQAAARERIEGHAAASAPHAESCQTVEAEMPANGWEEAPLEAEEDGGDSAGQDVAAQQADANVADVFQGHQEQERPGPQDSHAAAVGAHSGHDANIAGGDGKVSIAAMAASEEAPTHQDAEQAPEKKEDPPSNASRADAGDTRSLSHSLSAAEDQFAADLVAKEEKDEDASGDWQETIARQPCPPQAGSPRRQRPHHRRRLAQASPRGQRGHSARDRSRAQHGNAAHDSAQHGGGLAALGIAAAAEVCAKPTPTAVVPSSAEATSATQEAQQQLHSASQRLVDMLTSPLRGERSTVGIGPVRQVANVRPDPRESAAESAQRIPPSTAPAVITGRPACAEDDGGLVPPPSASSARSAVTSLGPPRSARQNSRASSSQGPRMHSRRQVLSFPAHSERLEDMTFEVDLPKPQMRVNTAGVSVGMSVGFLSDFAPVASARRLRGTWSEDWTLQNSLPARIIVTPNTSGDVATETTEDADGVAITEVSSGEKPSLFPSVCGFKSGQDAATVEPCRTPVGKQVDSPSSERLGSAHAALDGLSAAAIDCPAGDSAQRPRSVQLPPVIGGGRMHSIPGRSVLQTYREQEKEALKRRGGKFKNYRPHRERQDADWLGGIEDLVRTISTE